MKKKIRNLRYLFNAKGVAIVGVSKNPAKLGHVVMKNFLENGFSGRIYPVNPKYHEILGKKCYRSVKEIRDKVDAVIIATPANAVPKIIEECGEKGVKSIVVLSGGFSEVGNMQLEKEVIKRAEKYSIALVGPNCLGVYDPYSRIDSLFFPMHKLARPKPGTISFITQSGGVGTCLVDLAAHYGVGMAKFISYGNGSVLDEGDLIEFLGKDEKTEQIILYIEGTKDGKKLLRVMKEVSKKKPIIALKAGKTKGASKAAKSHTGNIAGNYLAYRAAFRQAEVIEAENLDELFEFVRIFKQPLPKGCKIGVITNGGGLGVLTADKIENCGLKLAELKTDSIKKARKFMPSYGNIGNPLDIIGDADVERYKKAIELMLEDNNVDALIINILFQSPSIDERLIDILVRASDDRRKPIAVVAVGGTYTDIYRKILDGKNVPTYGDPSSAVRAIKKLIDYAEFKRGYTCKKM